MKFPMKIRPEKTGFCSICGEQITDWAHILGRGSKGQYANDIKLLIELCKTHHKGENNPSTMRKIAEHQIKRHGIEWLQHCLDAARDIGTKPKWVILCLDMQTEYRINKLAENLRETEV